jgi:HEAT repeat protein
MISNMENNAELLIIFDQVQRASSEAPESRYLKFKDIGAKMHKLAEAHYEPAIKLFASGLNDADWNWRYDCLRCLGYHYRFDPDSEIVRKIQSMLTNDSNDFVRTAAASILSIHSKKDDPSLLYALKMDTDPVVRKVAYQSLCELMGIDKDVIRKELTNLKQRPSLESYLDLINRVGLSS